MGWWRWSVGMGRWSMSMGRWSVRMGWWSKGTLRRGRTMWRCVAMWTIWTLLKLRRALRWTMLMSEGRAVLMLWLMSEGRPMLMRWWTMLMSKLRPVSVGRTWYLLL